MRDTWKPLNEVLNKQKTSSAVDKYTLDDGSFISDPQNIVEYFNDFFVNIGDRLASDIPATLTNFRSYLKGSYVDSFVLHLTNPEVLKTIVNGLSNKYSYGVDSTPVAIMKKCISPIADVLAYVINCSFSSGCFPDELKIAKVCPVYKGGSKTSFSNYSPISVLPSFSKFFEKLVYNRLESYILSKNLLVNNQYGFRRMHSTYMAIMDMFDKVSE